jgi:hypothetical protein
MPSAPPASLHFVMRIQLLSDIHLEVDPSFTPTPAPGADLLVLAGDVGGQGPGDSTGTRLPANDPYGLARFSPKLGAWPTPVLFVPGNHEYDGFDIDETRAALIFECARLGITWLDQTSVEMGAVRFVGCTLWTDFAALSDWPDDYPGAMTHNLQMQDKAFRAASHHLAFAAARWRGEALDAPAVARLAAAHHAWLKREIAEPYGGKTVVITHFAPSLKSADPRHGVTPGTAAFCNGLDSLFGDVDLWLHGHLHCRIDYQAGRCRVVANPLGYRKKAEQEGFDGQLCIEV